VAHNPAAAIALAQTLKDDKISGVTRAVIGMLADKDVAAVVAALDEVIDYWYVTEPSVARACPVTNLRAALENHLAIDALHRVKAYAHVRDAVQQALLDAAAGIDRLLVVGSFYTVAEFLAAMESDADLSMG
jgi:dihydrofolate synthase/folylpolyglutamate synthase